MAASYPSSLPIKDAAGANLSSNPHSTLHDDMYDELVAIATELGTLPKGTFASVKARLDRFDTGAGTAWTPAVTQQDPLVVIVNRAVYTRNGRRISGDASVTISGAGLGIEERAVTISLPVAAVGDTNTILGEGWINDESVGGYFYFGVLMWSTSTTAVFLRRAEGASATYLGSTGFTAALKDPDVVAIRFDYEAAS